MEQSKLRINSQYQILLSIVLITLFFLSRWIAQTIKLGSDF